MNQYIIIGIGLVIAAGVLFFGLAGRETATKTDGSDFDRFASVSLVDYGGNNVSLEEFRGRPLVINSWASWCPFCREELPDLAELQKEFGGRIIVVAIDRQEPPGKAKEYTDGLGITDDMTFLLDASDSFYTSIGGFSMPETIFVSTDGEIVVHKRGLMDLDEMRMHVNKILPAGKDSL